MAKTRVTLTVPVPIEEVFDYLADFSNTEQWDPGVEAAHRLDEGPIGNGSRFRVSFKAGPVKLPLEYWITTHERPQRVVFAAGGAGLKGRDDIRVRAAGTGTEIDWQVEIGFRPPLGFLDPVLQPGLAAAAKKAGDGLRAELSEGSTNRTEH